MNQTTFSINKIIRNNATRVLINAGVNVRKAISLVKENLPYLFLSKKQIKESENSFKNI